MAQGKIDIYVYAHWKGLQHPKIIGVLSAHFAKGRKAFSFEYNKEWLKSEQQRLLDPDIQFFQGSQFPDNKANFGIFLDSMPDSWGRTLMERRAVRHADEHKERKPILYDIDYLLGVFDGSRMGALRFKTDLNGPFLDNNNEISIPPWASVRELQYAADRVENDDIDKEKKWLDILVAPGSSLGGARPKANILDESGNLWIAKFPSKNDTTDKAAWEYLAYSLGINAGITMAPCKIEKIIGKYHTFFTKRFDRENGERIHFASAMTMTGNNEDTVRDTPASYLDMAEFISNYGANVDENLHQLWRRIVFNIAISNTDDHLRNHGFILTDEGWVLSPAFDLNPSTDKYRLALNIDMKSNALDFDLARSVGVFFRLTKKQMNVIIDDVLQSVHKWQNIADTIGIPRTEQKLMESVFNMSERT